MDQDEFFVESELPPQQRRNRLRQEYLREYRSQMSGYFALWIMVPCVLFYLLVQAISADPGSVWSKVQPWFAGTSLTIALICGAIVAWRMYWAYLEVRVRQSQIGLLEENVSLKKQATKMLQQADRRGDNVELNFAEDGMVKSAKIVRSAVLLAQLRQQELERLRHIQQQQIGQSVVLKPGETAIFPHDEYRRIESQVPAQPKQLTGPSGSTPSGSELRASSPSGRRKAPLRSSSADEELAEKLAQIPTPSKPGVVQTFAELLDEGIIQAALALGLIALGYVTRDGEWALRFGTWLDLYSCGVGGVTGSGKTTTVRFLLFQAILAGARVLMVDPHIHEPEESLAAQFSMFKDIHLQKPCDDTPEKVAKRIRWFMQEYIRRKARGIKGPAYIFVLDEFNEIIALLPTEVKKELAELMLRIAQSGRKFGLFMMVIGQRWSEQDLGGKPYGAAIRTSLAATLTHRFTDEQQAAKLAGGRYAAECLSLDQGHYYFRDTHGGMSYTVTPDTVAEDGVEIQHLLDALENTVESALETAEKTPRLVVSRDTGPLANAPVAAPQAESDAENTRIYTLARQIVRLQAENVQKPEIMRRLWGVNPGGTEAYQQANEEYKAVMQFLAEQLGE